MEKYNYLTRNKLILKYRINSILLLIIHSFIMIDFILIDINFPFILEVGLLLFCIINNKELINYKINKLDIRISIYITIIFFILMIYKFLIINVSLLEIRYILIAFLLLIISSTLKVSKTTLEVICFLTLITATLIIFIYFNVNTAVIGDYFYHEKNAFAPILLVCTIWLLVHGRNKIIVNMYFVISIACLAILQSRLNLICLIVVSLSFFLIKTLKSLSKKYIIFITWIAIPFSTFILIYLFNSEFISKVILREDHLMYVNGNSFVDKITSGRITSLHNNLTFFTKSPLVGTMFDQEIIYNDPNSAVGIHSIWLRFLSYGGLLLYLPFVVAVITLIKRINLGTTNKYIFYSFLLIALINSLGEPFAPFGPLSSYFLFWLFLGYSLNKEYINEKVTKNH